MLLVRKMFCITDGSVAAGESGYQSLQAYLSLDQVSRQISLPAALCKLACAKMSAKIAFAIFAAIEKWCWPTCCQTTHLSTSICFVFAAAYLVLRPKAQ